MSRPSSIGLLSTPARDEGRRPEDTSAGQFQAVPAEPAARFHTLKLASFNIQTGISTASYREYITGSWRYVMPSTKRLPNLNRIARLLAPFDIVGLQEVDGGGLRSMRIVQTQYLAEHGGFPYWHNQINRRLGDIALHSNGLMSKLRPSAVNEYSLPGLPGRGALVARFGPLRGDALHLCVVHLALSRRARLKQLAFVSELIGDLDHVVLMGDLNCERNTPEMKLLTASTRLCDPAREIMTFPSWRPRKMLDHILVTPDLHVVSQRVLDCQCSDHLPLAMEVRLPEALRMAA